MKTHALFLLVLLVLGGLSVPAHAQTTVVNPRIVEFDPSADHATVGTDGQPLVQRYELRIFRLGTTQPYTTTDLGKPGPETDGKIRVDFSNRLSPWPPDGDYEARVAAVGPSGLGVSDPSNTFSLASATPPPICTYTLSPASLSLPAEGGSTPVTLTTGAGCAWTAASNAAWLTPGSTSGSGTATIAVVLSANTATTSRTATLTIGGQPLGVTQAAAAACVYAASPSVVSHPAGGGVSTITVTAGSGCGWSAVSNVAWAGVTPPAGTASGTATITVGANATTSTRSGTVTVAGQPITVNQAAAVPCSYSVAPTTVSVGASAASATVTVTAGAGCGWSAVSNVAWAGVSPPAATASGTATISVGGNTATSTRSGTVNVAGQLVTVNQAAAPCTYSLSSSSGSVAANGGGGTIGVTAGSGCGWTAASNAAWVTVTPTSGSASGSVGFSAQANTQASSRTATLTIAGRSYTLTQAPAACSYALTPATFNGTGYQQTFGLGVTSTAGCTWTASTASSWISLATTSGSASGTVTVSVTKNTSKAPRTGTIVVGGQTCTVTQPALTSPSQPKKPRIIIQ